MTVKAERGSGSRPVFVPCECKGLHVELRSRLTALKCTFGIFTNPQSKSCARPLGVYAKVGLGDFQFVLDICRRSRCQRDQYWAQLNLNLLLCNRSVCGEGLYIRVQFHQSAVFFEDQKGTNKKRNPRSRGASYSNPEMHPFRTQPPEPLNPKGP